MDAEKLKMKIKKKGFSAKKLAEKAGIERNALERKLTGTEDFLLWEIIKISKLLSLENKEMLNIFFDG